MHSQEPAAMARRLFSIQIFHFFSTCKLGVWLLCSSSFGHMVWGLLHPFWHVATALLLGNPGLFGLVAVLACLAALLWLSHLELVAFGQLLAVPQKWDDVAILLVDMDFHVDGVAAWLNGLDCPKWDCQSLELVHIQLGAGNLEQVVGGRPSGCLDPDHCWVLGHGLLVIVLGNGQSPKWEELQLVLGEALVGKDAHALGGPNQSIWWWLEPCMLGNSIEEWKWKPAHGPLN